jgi:hypothetical protein
LGKATDTTKLGERAWLDGLGRRAAPLKPPEQLMKSPVSFCCEPDGASSVAWRPKERKMLVRNRALVPLLSCGMSFPNVKAVLSTVDDSLDALTASLPRLTERR